MSGNKIALFNADLPKSVDNAVQNLSDRPTKSIGDTLSSLWYLVFGKIDHGADKKRAQHAVSLEQYEKELRDRISAVPKEFKQEPNTHIAAQALDDSKYCIEEESLRAMFVELLTKSADARFNGMIHPSFSDLIKKMNSIDASNLLVIKKKIFNEKAIALPLANIRIVNADSSFIVMERNLFLYNPAIEDLHRQATSVDVLATLGLIGISFEHSVGKDSVYDDFRNTVVYQDYQAQADALCKSIELEKGSVYLSELGKSFCQVCLQ